MHKKQPNQSKRRPDDTELRYLEHPEKIVSDGMSLFDMHEDMQTVDTIHLDDMKEDLRKELIHKNPR
ncbi:hypothetical protein QWT69_12245 [Sporosarcina oncorhynchi]|uniref:Uncharacterized protein n=1 Tax=Sporosarcina oncorhynchi TaxID=3056444 RepID=A0ABZ0L1Z8_9BACL|nr:hypothetical protein [Sporosarcina sp. T2O-4]WOV86650.1 hypothetical protein QWT69_12245 [Sporosarcina sp. T2O-4]